MQLSYVRNRCKLEINVLSIEAYFHLEGDQRVFESSIFYVYAYISIRWVILNIKYKQTI